MLNACNEPEILEMLMMAKTIINIVCIFAPIIVIVNSMIDVAKATVGKGMDEITANIKHIVPRLVAMSMVFLVPSFLQLTINMVDDYSKFATCLNMADEDGIQLAYLGKANRMIKEANNEDCTYRDYSELQVIKSKIKDSAQQAAISAATDSYKATLDNKCTKEITEIFTPSSGYVWPVEGGACCKINSGFGWRPPIYSNGVQVSGGRNHNGVDISGTGKNILAVKSGVVKSVYYCNCGGNTIIIDHKDGSSSVYAHGLSGSIRVGVGQPVTQGQPIMKVGNTGTCTTGPHLHFEIKVNGKAVDPLPLLR